MTPFMKALFFYYTRRICCYPYIKILLKVTTLVFYNTSIEYLLL